MIELFTIIGPSIVFWLGSAWIPYLIDAIFATEHSAMARLGNDLIRRHDNSENAQVAVSIGSLLIPPFIGVCAIIILAHRQPSDPLYLWLGYGLAAAAASCVAGVKFYRLSRLGEMTANLIARFRDAWRDRKSAIYRAANKQINRLNAMIPDDAWLDTRTALDGMRNDALPSLLAKRDELQGKLKRIVRIIAKTANANLTDFSQAHLEKAIGNRRIVQRKLDLIKNEISSCLSSLALLETDLIAMMISGDTEPVTNQLAAMRQRIADICTGKQEIEAYLNRQSHTVK